MVHATDITAVMLLQHEVERASETIKAQNKSLMNFANIVSHNLTSYANNLKVMLAMFENAPDTAGKNEIFSYIKDISTGFKSTVDNLVEVVRAHNLSTVPMQEVNIHMYINKAIDVLRPQISTTFATVQNYVNPVRTIEANPAYMESIVMNLISNAIKYRHPGRHPHIEVSTYVVGNETILSIRDNGLGIDLDKHRKDLFTMYKTFHGNEDATGIGLFITKYQVDAMGGHIGVESTLGEGTEFRVYFKTKQG
jgi:signal transduction histidine kinase